jgi:hypothetical protein
VVGLVGRMSRHRKEWAGWLQQDKKTEPGFNEVSADLAMRETYRTQGARQTKRAGANAAGLQDRASNK